MKLRNSKNHATTGLTAIEEEAAGLTPVWVVWWEAPDKSWESLCLSLAESDRAVEARQADHPIQHWGKVGRRDQKSILAWMEGHLLATPPDRVDDFVRPAKEFLRRVSVGESGPVIVRTW